MIIFLTAMLILVFIFIDLVPFYLNKQWKLFWTYSSLMLLVFVLTVLVRMDVSLPSPAVPLKKLVLSIFG